MDFKTNIISELYEKTKTIPADLKSALKDLKTISLAEILESSSDSISDIIDDINSNSIRVSIDSKALAIIKENDESTDKGKEISELLKGISKKKSRSISIDITGIDELDTYQLKKLSEKCKIGKVFVNDGWDKAAKVGISYEEYAIVTQRAEKMVVAAGVKDSFSEQEKFDKIYDYVVKNVKFDYNGQDEDCVVSRNVYGFFAKGKAVCAGICLGIVNLCKMAGIECEYVQGKGTSPKGKEESHSWIRVKIDGQWYNCDPSWDITNRKKFNQEYAFKQLSDERFYKNGMHEIDATYNPTYIRSYGEKYRFYDEELQYEDALLSHNSLEGKNIKDLYISNRSNSLANRWVNGALELTSNISCFFFGKFITKPNVLWINRWMQHCTTMDDDTRKKLKEKEVKLIQSHDEKAENKEKRKIKDGERKSKKQIEKQNKKKTLKKDEQSYKNPEEMSKVDIDREINEIKNKIDRMNGDYSKIDYDALEGAEALRYLRGELEFSRATETLIELKGKRVDNIADRIVELADKNWDEGLTNQDIEEFKLLADISQQIARIKRQPIDRDSTEKVAELCHGTIDKLQLEEITRVIDKAVVKSTISKKEVELGIKSSEESRSPRMRKILASSKNYETYMKKTQKYLDELDRKLEKQMKEEAATKKKAAKKGRISPEIPDGVTRPEPQAKGSEWHDSLRRGSNNKTQIDKSGEKGVPGEDDSVTKRPEPKDPDEWEV